MSKIIIPPFAQSRFTHSPLIYGGGIRKAAAGGGGTPQETGFTLAGAGAPVNTTAGPAWTNPGNITADDDTNAVCIFGAAGQGDDLKGSDFGFAIPGGATIDGFEVRAQLAENTNISYTYVNIGIDDSTLGTSKNPAQALSGILTDYDQGGAADLWGLTWTPAEVNSADFQVRIRVTNNTAGGDAGVCDAVWVNVHFTA
jgi:hypothetical protein